MGIVGLGFLNFCLRGFWLVCVLLVVWVLFCLLGFGLLVFWIESGLSFGDDLGAAVVFSLLRFCLRLCFLCVLCT